MVLTQLLRRHFHGEPSVSEACRKKQLVSSVCRINQLPSLVYRINQLASEALTSVDTFFILQLWNAYISITYRVTNQAPDSIHCMCLSVRLTLRVCACVCVCVHVRVNVTLCECVCVLVPLTHTLLSRLTGSAAMPKPV